ncbi:MAG TPA: hypothetical protein VIJ63_00555, partial [Roseiarcus sp.]
RFHIPQRSNPDAGSQREAVANRFEPHRARGEPASVQRSDLLSEVFAIDLAIRTRLASKQPLVMPAGWLSDG